MSGRERSRQSVQGHPTAYAKVHRQGPGWMSACGQVSNIVATDDLYAVTCDICLRAAVRLHEDHGHACDSGASPNCGANPCIVHREAAVISNVDGSGSHMESETP